MYLDLPFLNNHFSSLFADPTHNIPPTFKVNFVTLSFASTYLLALLLIIFLAFALIIITYL